MFCRPIKLRVFFFTELKLIQIQSQSNLTNVFKRTRPFVVEIVFVEEIRLRDPSEPFFHPYSINRVLPRLDVIIFQPVSSIIHFNALKSVEKVKLNE